MYKTRTRSTTDNWNGKRTSARKISPLLPLRGCSPSGTSARIPSPSPSHFKMLVFHSSLFIVQISTADNNTYVCTSSKKRSPDTFKIIADLQVAAQSVPPIRHVRPLSRSHDPVLMKDIPSSWQEKQWPPPCSHCVLRPGARLHRQTQHRRLSRHENVRSQSSW